MSGITGKIVCLILVGLVYALYSYSIYSDVIRRSHYYIVIAVVAGIVGNLLWVLASSKMNATSDILLYGVIWDVVISLVFIAVPFIFFGFRTHWAQFLGLILIIFGILVFKFGDVARELAAKKLKEAPAPKQLVVTSVKQGEIH